jgi:ABC-2 type transport system ATP-binding protein
MIGQLSGLGRRQARARAAGLLQRFILSDAADRIVVIDHGGVVAEGTASELKAQIGGACLEVNLSRPEGLGQVPT